MRVKKIFMAGCLLLSLFALSSCVSMTENTPENIVGTSDGTSDSKTESLSTEKKDHENDPVLNFSEYTTDICSSSVRWWDRGVQYPRLVELVNSTVSKNGTILVTFEQLTSGVESYRPGYPIYQSDDYGKTWKKICFVSDDASDMQSEWNPTLLELHTDCGDLKKGTVLLAGCSIDAAHSKKSAIRLYVSTDSGQTFSKPITIDEGTGLGEGVWEPHLVQLDDGRIVCYYSDDSASTHSQKIVYKISDDGVNFHSYTEVVATNDINERPGMPVVTRLGDGSYIMVYEIVDHRSISGNPIFYKFSKDGIDWGDASDIGYELKSSDGSALGSAPYCAWTPLGGEHGTIVVSGTFMRSGTSSTGTDYFISTDKGKTWTTIQHSIPYNASIDHCGYSNSMVFSKITGYLYSINNPTISNTNDKSKITFASKKWE